MKEYNTGTMNPESKANAKNSGHSRDSGNSSNSFWEWVKIIGIAILISLPIRLFIAEPFVVNGASMDPTFSTGQFLIVDRLTYRFEKPERGDVIVFQYPNDPHTYYIKRIIGLPSETIIMKGGSVTIKNSAHPDGVKLNETYISPSHASFDDLTVTLSADQYFVMGDNRAQSSDSRVWGPLPRNLIVGRPAIRLWPTSIYPGQDRIDNN